MNLSNSLSSIEEKVERLINLCEVYKRKIVELERANEELKEEWEKGKLRAKNLEEKQQMGHIVKNSSLSNENKLDTKRKITDFVQEIEKCIEILNYNDSILK